MAWFVYSTLASNMEYTPWEVSQTDKNALPIKKKGVFIKGGTGVATKELMTPRGIRTEVTDEEMEILKNDYVFREIHLKHGFVTIENVKAKAEKVAANMNMDDKSAPLTPEKIKAQGGAQEAKMNARK